MKTRWAVRWLIVPEAHFRIGDFQFQAELYDVFHRRWVSRIGHLLCTPAVVLGAFVALNAIPVALTSSGPVGGLPAGGLFLAGGLAAYFFGLDAFVGLVATPVVAALLAASIPLARLLGERAPLVGGVAMAAGATLQAITHLFEEVPPPWSGQQSFRPLRDVVREASLVKLLGMAALTPVSFALEWWASFRVLGLQLNFLAMKLGLRRALAARLEDRRAAILADPELLTRAASP